MEITEETSGVSAILAKLTNRILAEDKLGWQMSRGHPIQISKVGEIFAKLFLQHSC